MAQKHETKNTDRKLLIILITAIVLLIGAVILLLVFIMPVSKNEHPGETVSETHTGM